MKKRDRIYDRELVIETHILKLCQNHGIEIELWGEVNPIILRTLIDILANLDELSFLKDLDFIKDACEMKTRHLRNKELIQEYYDLMNWVDVLKQQKTPLQRKLI